MSTSVPMAATNPEHFASAEFDAIRNQDNGPGQADVLVSGNDVNLEQEFLKSNDVMRGYTLNTQIMKTFDRMLQSVTKG